MSRSEVVAVGLILACGSSVAQLGACFRHGSDLSGVSAITITGSEGDDGLASSSPAPDRAREVVSLRPDELAVDAAPAGLNIRSAAGLALACVEIEIEPGRWQRRDLVQGVCDPGPARPPWNVRAPGHVPSLARQLGDEIVLEADSLLEIVAPGLRSCFRWWGAFAWLGADLEPSSPEWREAFWMRATQGFTSDDRWAIAVNGEGLNDVIDRPRELTISFKDPTHRMVRIQFNAAPGVRASWSPACPPEIDALALDVEIQRPADAPAVALEWVLRMHREVDEPLTWTRYAWGQVAVLPDLEYWAQGKLGAEETHLLVERVPRGEQAELTLHDPISGAHGQARFVNDGTPLRVSVRAGFTLRGKLAVPPGRTLPKSAWFRFGARREPPDDANRLGPYATSLPTVALTTEGEFEVRGPQPMYPMTWIGTPAPDVILLEVEAPGFELHHSTWPLGEATRVDCGTLELVPSGAGIVLAPGHGLKASHFINFVHTGPGKDQVWRVNRGRDEADGSMTLVFLDRQVERTSLPGMAAKDVDALMAACSGPLVRAFVRGADGRFARVEEEDYEVKVVLDPPLARDMRGQIAWSWRGMPQQLTGLHAKDPAEPRLLQFRAPRDGVDLSWSITDGTSDGRRAGIVPLNATPMTVTLP